MKTDYHCHILPGLDDGAQSREEAVCLARQLVRWGFQRAVCTSHIAYLYRNTPRMIKEACACLEQDLRKQSITLELVPSAEYRLIPETWHRVVENRWFLPWDDKYLLLELPIRNRDQLGNIDPLQEIERMKEFGFVPVIAHPERYVWLSHEELTEFCKQGALLQINYPSLCGRYGEEIKQRADGLITGGYASFYGTDLHSEDYVSCLDAWFAG